MIKSLKAGGEGGVNRLAVTTGVLLKTSGVTLSSLGVKRLVYRMSGAADRVKSRPAHSQLIKRNSGPEHCSY